MQPPTSCCRRNVHDSLKYVRNGPAPALIESITHINDRITAKSPTMLPTPAKWPGIFYALEYVRKVHIDIRFVYVNYTQVGI